VVVETARLDRRSNFERNGPPPAALLFSIAASAFCGLIDACEMMVNSGKACLVAECFLGLEYDHPHRANREHPAPAKGHNGCQ
jgi:hypothetical protein